MLPKDPVCFVTVENRLGANLELAHYIPICGTRKMSQSAHVIYIGGIIWGYIIKQIIYRPQLHSSQRVYCHTALPVHIGACIVLLLYLIDLSVSSQWSVRYTKYLLSDLWHPHNSLVWELWSMTQNSQLKFFLCWSFICGVSIVISRGGGRSHPWEIWEIQDGRQYGHQHLGDL